MSNIENQVQNAIAAERKESRKRDRLKAVVVVFVIIPLVVVGTVGVWLAAQRAGLI
jgi:nitrate reductase NapE component